MVIKIITKYSNSSMLNASDFVEEIKRDSVRLSKEVGSEYKYCKNFKTKYLDSSAIPFDVWADINPEIKEYDSDDSEKENPHSIRKEHSVEEDADENFPFGGRNYQFDVMSPKDKNLTIEFKSRNSYPINSDKKENLSARLNKWNEIIG